MQGCPETCNCLIRCGISFSPISSLTLLGGLVSDQLLGPTCAPANFPFNRQSYPATWFAKLVTIMEIICQKLFEQGDNGAFEPHFEVMIKITMHRQLLCLLSNTQFAGYFVLIWQYLMWCENPLRPTPAPRPIPTEYSKFRKVFSIIHKRLFDTVREN